MKKLVVSILALGSIFNGTQDLVAQQDSITVYIIGDVMMHSPQIKYDHSTFLQDLKENMTAADLGIANMEFSLGGEPYMNCTPKVGHNAIIYE